MVSVPDEMTLQSPGKKNKQPQSKTPPQPVFFVLSPPAKVVL